MISDGRGRDESYSGADEQCVNAQSTRGLKKQARPLCDDGDENEISHAYRRH